MLLFAGHDTSSAAMSVMMLCLGLSPAAYRRLQEEQAQVVKAHGEVSPSSAKPEPRGSRRTNANQHA